MSPTPISCLPLLASKTLLLSTVSILQPKSSPTSSKLEQDFLKVQRRLKSLSKQLADGDARVSSYYSVDPLLGFKERVRDALKWPVDKEIRDLPVSGCVRVYSWQAAMMHTCKLQACSVAVHM